MWQTIISLLRELLGLAGQIAKNQGDKINLKEPAIRADAEKDAARHAIRRDRKLDRYYKKEPKELLCFSTIEDFSKGLEKGTILYAGTRETITTDIVTDPAGVLTRKQQKQLADVIKRHIFKYYIVRVHPVTVHR